MKRYGDKLLDAAEAKDIDKAEKNAQAFMDTVAKIEATSRDEMVKNAVLKTAQDIVTSVMRDNADHINAQIGKQIEAYVENQLTAVEARLEVSIGKRFAELHKAVRDLDALDRGSFLTALDELNEQRGAAGEAHAPVVES